MGKVFVTGNIRGVCVSGRNVEVQKGFGVMLPLAVAAWASSAPELVNGKLTLGVGPREMRRQKRLRDVEALSANFALIGKSK